MTRSALANAFILLRRKPAILLLLLPIQALVPWILPVALQPAGLPGGDATMGPESLLFPLLCSLIVPIALVRYIFLVAPAVELMQDGAAAVETPSGWFGRGIRRHWWKRLSVAVAEWGVSSVLSIVLYVGAWIVFLLSLLFVVVLFYSSASDIIAACTVLWVVMLVAALALYLAIFVFQFTWESLGAYLLPAMADRGFAGAFKAVFSKLGMRKFLKILGGRFLVGAIRSVILGVFLILYYWRYILPETPAPNSGDPHMLVLAAGLSGCIFINSCLGIYRNAFEFCVFREAEDGKTTGRNPVHG